MKEITIQDIGTIITGSTPPTSKTEYFGNDYLFIKPSDIEIGTHITVETETMLSKLSREKYPKLLIPEGSTCVVCIGSIGQKMTYAHQACFTNQQINSIIPNENYDNKYVFYLMKNNLHKLKAANQGSSSGRENVSKYNFAKIKVDVVEDIEKQRKIAQILSAYDELMENNQKQIKLLEEAAQRLYKEWFVDLRFPGYEDAEIVDGMPAGWEKKAIGDAFITVLGGTPSRAKASYWNGDIPWINSGEVNSLRIVKESEFITEEGLKKSSTKLMPKHTTVLAITGATLGQVSYTEIETCANQSVVGIIDEQKKYFAYLYLFVSNNIWSMIGKATGGAQQHINKDIVNEYPIILPSEDTILKLNSVVEPMFSKMADLYSQNMKLVEARDRLLPKLMSGEIEV